MDILCLGVLIRAVLDCVFTGCVRKGLRGLACFL